VRIGLVAELRLGLIGCGRLAERGYLPALERVREVRLAAVADTVRERGAHLAPGVPSFRDAAELLDAGGVDALVLATPVAAHLADAQLAADAGIAVLIEKPPARDEHEASLLASLHPAPRLAFNRRFEPELAAVRQSVQAADSPVELSLIIRARKSSWPSYEADDDVLLNLGPHVVDLALWIAGALPDEIRGSADGDRARIELAFGRRLVARIECAANRPYLERIVAKSGERQFARYERGGLLQGARAIVGGGRVASPLVPSLVKQLEAFGRAVRGAVEPDLATAAQGTQVMRVLDAVRMSQTA
jgi:predicted dehydrogenase